MIQVNGEACGVHVLRVSNVAPHIVMQPIIENAQLRSLQQCEQSLRLPAAYKCLRERVLHLLVSFGHRGTGSAGSLQVF